MQRLLQQDRPDGSEARAGTREVASLGHDHSQIPVHARSPAGVRAKLTVNPTGDIYEREADRIAVEMAAPARDAPGGAPPPIQRLGGQPAGRIGVAPASVVQALAGFGRPLEPTLRQDMEQRFGHDFSRVRVHTGALAEQSARDVSARAFTVGHDIVFGAGGLASGTQEGRRLIAHELTHVVQQTGADRDVAPSVQRAPVPPAEIEMPEAYVRPVEPSAVLKKFTSQPTYIDNNIKGVSFITAEQAIIRYHDGTTFELGLVSRWMKPPVEEVDYHTPREEFRLRHDAREGISFIRESDLRNVPRTMTLSEIQKRYAKPIDFFVQKGTARIVPSRVNMLTAPTLCKVLLDSEKKFVEQIRWVAEWGTEVAKVIPGMGGGFAGGGRSLAEAEAAKVAGRMAGRRAASRAVKQMTEQMDDLLKVGGEKNIYIGGVVFERVQIARQGGALVVRRWRTQRIQAPPGHGKLMHETFEDAAVSVARTNGLKTVTINVGVVINREWGLWLKSLGYVKNQDGHWIKTISL